MINYSEDIFQLCHQYNNVHIEMLYFHLIVATVMFNQSIYSVNENEGLTQPTLVLSKPSTTVFTVQVTNTDGSATGEY